MGLDISHDAWHGAYSAFHYWRLAVCEATGGRFAPDGVAQTMTWYFGEGYDSESHPGLYALLAHSDCDGEIAPDVAGKLADELEALLPKLDALGDGHGHIKAGGGYGGCARRMIAGCRLAAERNEPLDFH